MSLILSINSDDRLTGYYVPGTGRITRAKKSRSSCNFDLFDRSQVYRPLIGYPVEFGDSSVTFYGTIDSIQELRKDNTDTVCFKVTCQDYGAVCDHRFVSRRYPAGSNVIDIINDINNNYLDGELFGTSHVTTAATIGSELLFDYRTVTECLNTLADLAGCEWWILNHDIYFKSLANAPAAPYSITNSSLNWKDLDVTYARSTSYRNRQFLRSAVPLETGSLTETTTFDGIEFSMGTLFPLTSNPVFKLNGVAQPVAQFGLDAIASATLVFGGSGYAVNDLLGVDGGTGGEVIVSSESGGVVTAVTLATPGSGYTGGSGTQTTTGGTGTGCTVSIVVHIHPEAGTWFWVMNGYGVREGTDSPPAAGVVGTIIYGGYLSTVVLVEDATEVAARAAIEGGSGKWDALDEEHDVDTLAVANALATGILDRSKVMPVTIRYSTLVGGIDPGMKQTVNLTANGINATYYVSAVSSEALPSTRYITERSGGTTMFRHQVTLTNAIDQGSWIKFWENLYSRGKGGSTVSSGGGSGGTGSSTDGNYKIPFTAVITPDLMNGKNQELTLAGNVTIMEPSADYPAGTWFDLDIITDTTGPWIVAWAAGYRGIAGYDPDNRQSKRNAFRFKKNSAGNWDLAVHPLIGVEI